MEVVIVKDYDEMSEKAAQIVVEALRKKPALVLGLATGSTPEGLYARLVDAHENEGIDFSQVVSFNLDEYVGLPADHEQSYHYFMDDKLFNHVNVKRENIHVPDGVAADLTEECARYEQMIKDAGGIDIQVLGIGRDGHVGFNEPGTSLGSTTQVVSLTEETIEDNSRYFESEADVPRFAVTMGIKSILETRSCLLLASGENKVEAIQKAVEGPVTASVTASALQFHPCVTAIVDEAAASGLERLEYYRWVQANKARIAGKL